MPQVILPNKQVLNFPDDTSEDVMRNAIYTHFPEYAPKQTQGFSGIASDIYSGIKNAPGEALSAIGQLPGHLVQSGVQVATNPLRAAENVVSGIGEGIEGISDAPSYLSNYLNQKGIHFPGQDYLNRAQIPDLGIEKTLGLNTPQTGDQLLRTAGSFIPFSGVGRGVEGVAGLAERAAASGAYGATQQQNPLTTALLSLTADTAPAAIKNVAAKIGQSKAMQLAKSLSPTSILRGKLSDEELQKNLGSATGTNTPLGNIVGSPLLSKLHNNIIQNVPFSGAENTLSALNSQVQGAGDTLLSALNPNTFKGDSNLLAEKLLNTVFNNQKNAKNSLYKKVDDQAQAEGHELNLSNFQNEVMQNKDALENSPLLKNNPKFRRMISRLGGLDMTPEEAQTIKSPIVDEFGKNFTQTIEPQTVKPSILEANLVKSDLYNEAQKNLASQNGSDRAIGNMYQRLAGKLGSDVDNSITTTGSPELQKANAEAKANYKKNYSPFLDKSIFSYLNGKKDPQSIVQEIIKPSAKLDKYRDIQKFQNLLPEGQKGLLGYSYLSNAIDRNGNLDANKLTSLVNSLGKRQFNTLFPSQPMQDAINNYSNLRSINKDTLKSYNDPNIASKGLGSLADILTGLVGGHIGGVVGGGLGILGLSALARGANHLLTSPTIRENLVNKMLKKGNTYEGQVVAPQHMTDPTAQLVKALVNIKNKNIPQTQGQQ